MDDITNNAALVDTEQIAVAFPKAGTRAGCPVGGQVALCKFHAWVTRGENDARRERTVWGALHWVAESETDARQCARA